MKVIIKQLPQPVFGFPGDTPVVPSEEYDRRLSALLEASGMDWVLVYADREHYGNLVYLTNFDPRFEEALLVLGRDGKRVLITGNEGLGYVSVLRVAIDVALCQTFSLNSQPRSEAPRLKDVLVKIGLQAGQSAGVIGWKYLEAFECEDPILPAFIPAFIVDVIRGILGPAGKLVDQTKILTNPEMGLRAQNSADQIAAFEWGARCASAAVFGVIQSVRPGMSEHQAVSGMQYAGLPMSMHPIFVTGKGQTNGLRSASSKVIEYGDSISTAIGFWGSLVCRSGMVLGEVHPDYVERVAQPYFSAWATWVQSVQIGAAGNDIFQAVGGAFAGSGMHSALNPGHLTSFDEWVSSPIRAGSTEKIRSGMVLQSDIIPTPVPDGYLINCEDTLAVANVSLRAELKTRYPDLWLRVERRRKLAAEGLGLHLADEILPLSDSFAYLPPFWLISDWVCALE
jgi:hypothetical protein